MAKKIIVWLRRDLRLLNNPALYYASQQSDDIIPLFILDKIMYENTGSAQRWWLYHSLSNLQERLQAKEIKLLLKRDDPTKLLLGLVKELNVEAIYWNRRYEPWAIEQDKKVKQSLHEAGIEVKSFKGYLLFEPWEIKNKQGEFFKVFTPFWKNCIFQGISQISLPEAKLKQTTFFEGEKLDDWHLLPKHPDWTGGIQQRWQPGELHALKRLETFLEDHLINYSIARDVPSIRGTSFLSPHLHFGEISPLQIWHAISQAKAQQVKFNLVGERYLSELGWREFSYHLLYHVPNMLNENFQSKFNNFAWENNSSNLLAWQKGKTGYPIVDAGMRELWQTGYMHNRVRMIVASFLTKHLLIDWRLGAAWFLDTLVDADWAVNAMNWQWVNGSGVDASPYYRIFNPITQGEKFDPEGIYVRQWVSELNHLSNRHIHKPWQLDKLSLQQANIELGKTYPLPLVDHNNARARALSNYKLLSNKT